MKAEIEVVITISDVIEVDSREEADEEARAMAVVSGLMSHVPKTGDTLKVKVTHGVRRIL